MLWRADQLDPDGAHPVDRGGGAAAGGRQYRDLAARSPFFHELDAATGERRDLQQGFEQIDPQDAAIAKECVRRRIVTGNGARMRYGQCAARFGAAELVDDHRLAGFVRSPRHCRQRRCIADRFQKQQDRLGSLVVDQRLGDFAHRQIRLIADRDQL